MLMILASILVVAIVMLIFYKILSIWFSGTILTVIGMIMGLGLLIYGLHAFGWLPAGFVR